MSRGIIDRFKLAFQNPRELGKELFGPRLKPKVSETFKSNCKFSLKTGIFKFLKHTCQATVAMETSSYFNNDCFQMNFENVIKFLFKVRRVQSW